MGSVIFQAGDLRIMAPNAKQLIHYGTPLHADSELHAKSQYNWTEECKKFSAWMELMYLAKIHDKQPEFKLKRLQKMLNFDTILSAQESVELGLADKILGEDDV
jgi:ATP-dependent protease ClpP protease subunit